MPCRMALKAAAVHASHLSVLGRCEIRRDILSMGLDGGDQASDGRQEEHSAHHHEPVYLEYLVMSSYDPYPLIAPCNTGFSRVSDST